MVYGYNPHLTCCLALRMRACDVLGMQILASQHDPFVSHREANNNQFNGNVEALGSLSQLSTCVRTGPIRGCLSHICGFSLLLLVRVSNANVEGPTSRA